MDDSVARFCYRYFISCEQVYDTKTVEMFGYHSRDMVHNVRYKIEMATENLTALSMMYDREARFARIRSVNPAVQHAYDQYVMLAELTQ